MSDSEAITVAVVDDDESLCRSLARLLRATGFLPVTFSSAEDFLASETTAFDCLVLDIQLCGISGVELHQHLIASGCRIPVIYITASDDPELRDRAFAIGCIDFLPKTAPGKALLDSLRRATAASGSP